MCVCVCSGRACGKLMHFQAWDEWHANVIGAERALVLPSLTRWCIVANMGLHVGERRFKSLRLSPMLNSIYLFNNLNG